MRSFCGFLSLAVALALSSASAAAPLYMQNFDVDDTANWAVNASTGANVTDTYANFYFDYSTVGIPSAPNSGGTTRGLKMYANHTNGVFGGLSVSPVGQSFSGDYIVTFDAWMNYNGAASPGNGLGVGGDVTAGGGNGSTHGSSWGIMTSGTVSQWAGGAHDSLWFSAVGDGGSAQDYRVYPKGAIALPASGYYAAGTSTSPDSRNDLHDYYNGVGGKAAPAAQLSLYPQQSGTTRDGAPGMAWRQMEIKKSGNIVTWKMDGLLISTVDTTTITGSFGGSNIFFGHFDTNATSSTDINDANLLFTLIDNVVVVPEPGTFALCIFGAIGSLFVRRRS